MLVMWGHFITVGGNARSLPLIIGEAHNSGLPLYDGRKWAAGGFEVFLTQYFDTQSAVLGVSLFFLVTGLLMPLMMERYNRRGFALNRFFRIFPTLLLAVAAGAVILGLTQNITFSPLEIFASLTLTYPWFGALPVLPILWTLVIEVTFYAIVLVLGKVNLLKVFATQVFLLSVIFIGVRFQENYYLWLAGYHARYLLLILIGSCVYLAGKEEKTVSKILIVASGIAVSYLGFQLFSYSKTDATSYANLRSQILAVVIFLVLMYVGARYISRVPRAIRPFAEMVYPVYLLHGLVGFLSMFYLRAFTLNPFVLVGAATLASFIASWIVHKLVELPGLKLGRKITEYFDRVRGSS